MGSGQPEKDEQPGILLQVLCLNVMFAFQKAALEISVEFSNGSHTNLIILRMTCYTLISSKPILASLRTDRKDEKEGRGRERITESEGGGGIKRGKGREEKESKKIREGQGEREGGRKGEKEGFQGKGSDQDLRA